MPLQIKRFPQILNDAIAWMVASQSRINSQLTDFNDGSMIRSYLEAVANEMEQAYLTTRVGFDSALPTVAQSAFNFLPLGGAYGTGTVVFSCVAAAPVAVLISTGTIVSTLAGLRFETTASGTIALGGTSSGAIPVRAMDVGTIYNVPAAAISVITTPVIGAQSVTNAAAISGGVNSESSATYLTRFQTFIAGLTKSSTAGIITAAKSVVATDGSIAQQVSVIENIPPVAVSSYTGGINSPGAINANITVYVDNGGGLASAALLAAVGTAIWGDNTTVNPGAKAAGIGVHVRAVSPLYLDIIMSVRRNNTVADAVIITSVIAGIQGYINSLVVGQVFYANEVVGAVMNVPGVLDIAASPAWTINAIAPANITPSAGVVVKSRTLTISVTS